jgi:hypothetical protein
VVALLATAVVAVSGCGRKDFANDPRPAVAAEISVKIAKDGVAVSPKQFGAGLVNFTVANLTDQAGSLVIHGPVDATSPEVPPAGALTFKVEMKTGNYQASVDGITVRPFSFRVGPERGSGQNDLLLP